MAAAADPDFARSSVIKEARVEERGGLLRRDTPCPACETAKRGQHAVLAAEERNLFSVCVAQLELPGLGKGVRTGIL